MIKLLSKEIRKNTILHLSQQADFITKENYLLYCSTSCLPLQIQPRKTFAGHCFICSYRKTHRTEGTTYMFAQVPFPHRQDMALASESLPRYRQWLRCLWRWAGLPTRGKWGVGTEASPASCWQTISLSNWPIFDRIISLREQSTAAL